METCWPRRLRRQDFWAFPDRTAVGSQIVCFKNLRTGGNRANFDFGLDALQLQIDLGRIAGNRTDGRLVGPKGVFHFPVGFQFDFSRVQCGEGTRSLTDDFFAFTGQVGPLGIRNDLDKVLGGFFPFGFLVVAIRLLNPMHKAVVRKQFGSCFFGGNGQLFCFLRLSGKMKAVQKKVQTVLMF